MNRRFAGEACSTGDADRVEVAAVVHLGQGRSWSGAFRRVATYAWHYAMWRPRLHAFGIRSFIEAPAWICGGAAIAVGERVTIWRGSRLEAFNVGRGQVRLRIGDSTAIHPFVHIGAAEYVEIGRGVLMASHIYITDHDHDWSNPDEPVVDNNRLLVAPVRIGDYVWLGERAMVLKGVTIGQRSIIGAGSIVTRDIPEYSVAVGSPARVIRRFDHEAQTWVKV